MPFEFIIVSNGNTQHHGWVRIHGECARVDRVILNRYNGFSTHARAIGARIARGSILVFLDDDFEYEKKWLTLMLELLRRQGEERTVVSGFLWHKHGFTREGPDWVDPEWPTDGCCMIARELYDKGRGYRLEDPAPRPRYFIERLKRNVGDVQFLSMRPGVVRHWGHGRRSICYRAGHVQRDAEGVI